MLVIRLLRTGKKNQPFFQIVVTDKKNPPRGGRFVEKVGYLNPLTKEISLKKERIQYWLDKGVKCSDRVHNLLIKEKVLEGEKIPLHKKKKEKKKAEAEAKPAEKPTEKPEEKPEKKEEPKEEKPKEEVKPEKKKPEEKKEPEKAEEPKVEEKKEETKPAEEEKKKA